MKLTLYNLTGLPYSGKSTLSKTLINQFDLQLVSVDNEIDKRNFEIDQMSQDDWNLVYSKAYEQIKSALQSEKSVLFDMGNLKRSERETAENITNVI